MDVVSIQWQVIFGTFGVPLNTDRSGAAELTWELTPGRETDGTRMKCVIIVRGGLRYEQLITISVQQYNPRGEFYAMYNYV